MHMLARVPRAALVCSAPPRVADASLGTSFGGRPPVEKVKALSSMIYPAWGRWQLERCGEPKLVRGGGRRVGGGVQGVFNLDISEEERG
eukprot:CAMPEP_0196597512 /NCGR_PEP_ID=MMETSP1081-20130531/91734_1 /TAXON_ID=36882 /ORGANISM="Pyramimonas amylifera, Strain CCMP720" /LENGTH=88 /DNA_ID=CAMNT_0041922933 /DNA_START=614 /DNA_END=875 /DNA_ORIENTATION=+